MDATRYRVGTASWTDPTLLAAGFYPPTARSAEARLRYYAEHFDTVEVDSTFYALPSQRNALLWDERTPSGFLFHVKAFAWLTGHEAEIRALPPDLRQALPAAAHAKPRAGAPAELRDAAFPRFLSALDPLKNAGKLGHLLFQFPPWFGATDEGRSYLRLCRRQCAGYRLAVEFRHASWLGPESRRTLDLLRELDLTFVAIDAPSAPSIPRTPLELTTEEAYVRFHGRDRQAWFRRGGTAAERFRYRYADDELGAAATRLRELSAARQVHVLFNNCYADFGVRNALTMRGLLAPEATKPRGA